MSQSRLHAVPLTFKQACAFVAQFHRHNKPPRGMKFAVGVADENGTLRGVVMAGRPVARSADDGWTLEVNRTCTDGCENANSFLYGVARRIAKEMGYRKLITYTQADESGVSLRAAGWQCVAELPSRGSWAASSKKLKDIRDPIGNGGVPRKRWEVHLS